MWHTYGENADMWELWPHLFLHAGFSLPIQLHNLFPSSASNIIAADYTLRAFVWGEPYNDILQDYLPPSIHMNTFISDTMPAILEVIAAPLKELDICGHEGSITTMCRLAIFITRIVCKDPEFSKIWAFDLDPEFFFEPIKADTIYTDIYFDILLPHIRQNLEYLSWISPFILHAAVETGNLDMITKYTRSISYKRHTKATTYHFTIYAQQNISPKRAALATWEALFETFTTMTPILATMLHIWADSSMKHLYIENGIRSTLEEGLSIAEFYSVLQLDRSIFKADEFKIRQDIFDKQTQRPRGLYGL
jgi:hypothetical protein